MAQAEIHEVLTVDKGKLWDAIVRYEDYPKFVDGCTGVKVERKGAGHARATYNVSMMKDVTYTLDHKEDKDKGVVEWTSSRATFSRRMSAAGSSRTRAPARPMSATASKWSSKCRYRALFSTASSRRACPGWSKASKNRP